jgi:hypothetical protein
MMIDLLKYLSVFLSSAFRFSWGIILGTVGKLNVIELSLCSFLGAMTAVSITSFLANKYLKQLVFVINVLKRIYFKLKLIIVLNFGKLAKKDIRAFVIAHEAKMRPRTFTKTSRLAVKTWKRFGLWGISILTPIILSPVGGSLIAVSFKVKTPKIISYMAVTHFVASILFSIIFTEFKEIIQLWTGINLEAG